MDMTNQKKINPIFLKSFEKPKFKSCPVGSHIVQNYVYDIDEKTGFTIKVLGKKEDIYKSIQAYARTCGVRFILSQVATGRIDLKDLKKDFQSTDTTIIPDNIHDIYKMGSNVVDSYDNDKILQSIYKTKEAFKNALANGEDISKKVNDFTSNYKKRIFEFFYKKYENKKINEASKKVDNKPEEVK